MTFFQKNWQGPQCWSFELSTKRLLAHLRLQMWSWDLDLVCSTWNKVMRKSPQKKEDLIIFINFGIKKFIERNTQKINELMFECYNLLDLMERGALIFWGWFQQGEFKILWLLHYIFILYFFNWFFSIFILYLYMFNF